MDKKASAGSAGMMITVEKESEKTAKYKIQIWKAEPWSPESPKQYTLATRVENNGSVVDSVETEFGIRTVAFDPTNGFLLNGKPYFLKGTCEHQDHAGVGTAM